MKSKISDKQEAGKFMPVTIELTLESVDELHNLWHRHNISDDAVKKAVKDHSCPAKFPVPSFGLEGLEFWEILDKLTKNQVK